MKYYIFDVTEQVAFLSTNDLAEYLGCSKSKASLIANKQGYLFGHSFSRVTLEEIRRCQYDVYYSEDLQNHLWIHDKKTDKWFYNAEEAGKEIRCSRELISHSINTLTPIRDHELVKEKRELNYEER